MFANILDPKVTQGGPPMAARQGAALRDKSNPPFTLGSVARYCDDVLMGEMALRELYGDDDLAFHADAGLAYRRISDRVDLGRSRDEIVRAIHLYLGEALPEDLPPEAAFHTVGAVTARAPGAMRLTLCLVSARAMHSEGVAPEAPVEDRKRCWLAGARAALGAADRVHALRQDLDRGLRRVAMERLLSLRVVSASGLSFAATDLLYQHPQPAARAAVAVGRPARNTVRLLQQRLKQQMAANPCTNS